MNSKKLQQINEAEGFSAVIHGGSDRVEVLRVFGETEFHGDYCLSFYKNGENMPSYADEIATPENLETVMRKYQPDLRKWHKLQVDMNQ